MKNKNLVSITDFTKEEYLRILELAAEFEKNPRQEILNGFVISTLFFEPSIQFRFIDKIRRPRYQKRIFGKHHCPYQDFRVIDLPLVLNLCYLGIFELKIFRGIGLSARN